MNVLAERPTDARPSIESLRAELAQLESRPAHDAGLEIDWREVIDTCNDAYFAADAAGCVVEWSEKASSLFGWTRSDVLGRPLEETLLPGDSAGGQRGGLALLAANQTEGKRLEANARCKDGTIMPTEASVSSMCCGSQVVFNAFLHDITSRQELQTQLAHAQKLESIGQLSAGIAHEINTPTQYVGDNARFLEEAFTDLATVIEAFNALTAAASTNPSTAAAAEAATAAMEEADLAYLMPEIKSAIEQSLEGVDRVAKIVRAMKEFSHPGTATKTPTDLAAAIRNTVTVATNEWKYVATVETDFDPTLPPVPCLPGDLNQVFLNLIVNAAHAMRDSVEQTGEKGVIRIVGRQDDDTVVITVEDNGSGIPDDIVGRVFDPFFTTKDVGVGTGQGLAIARSVVVDKHDGEIEVATKVGKGTRFTIRLPLGD